MSKYKARGGGSGYWLVGIILIIALGLIGLTVWLVIKNQAPATCDVSVTSVSVSQTKDSTSGAYPVTINYRGNGSNACSSSAGVTINGTITDSSKNTTPFSTSSPVPLSTGQYIVDTQDPKSTVTLTYFLVNADGSEGPHHTYP